MSKPTSEELFDLIKLLSKSEKRYFKLFASKHVIGEENKYVTVFDIIDKQTQYDENKILKKAGITKTQLSTHKKHLYKLLLQSEENYHGENNVERKIKHLLLHTEILFEKGLPEQCEKMLHKAKGIAQKHEKYELLTEILEWQRRTLNRNPQNHNFLQKKDAIYNEKNKAIKKMQNINEYTELADKMYSFNITCQTLRSDDALHELKKIMSHPLLQDENKAITNESKRLFYHIWGWFYKKTGEVQKSYNCRKKNVELLQFSPEEICERPDVYFSSLYNLALACDYAAKQEEMVVVLKKMRQLPEMLGKKCTEDFKVNIFQLSYNLELGAYLMACQFKKAIALISDIEKGFEEFEGKISKQNEIIFYFNGGLVYFIQCQYHNALTFINKIINDTADIREDVYSSSRILNLLIHYELGNEELLESVVKSTYRYLYKKNRLYKTETALLNFIRTKVPKFFTAQERLAAFKELKTEMEEITKDPFEKNVLDEIDYISWLESKIEGKGFAEVLSEKKVR